MHLACLREMSGQSQGVITSGKSEGDPINIQGAPWQCLLKCLTERQHPGGIGAATSGNAFS
jgi:hypothetical protein